MSQPSEATLDALTFIRANPECTKYADFVAQFGGAGAGAGAGMDRHTWKRLRWEVKHDRRYRVQTATVEPTPTIIPDNINVVTEQPLTLDLQSWLYASDFHAPQHHRGFCERLVKVGESAGVKDLILGGDIFDFAGLSHFPRTERQSATEDVMKVGGELVLWLAEHFRLYILPGNHDERYAKRLNDYTRFSRLVYAALEGKQPRNAITITSYDYIYVGPEETGWVVGHPRYFSTIPARGGADVAMLQHRSVIGAHNHIVGLMQSRCGRYWSIDPGHMTDPTMTPYFMQSNGLSKYPNWKNGYVLIRNNVPTLCVDGLVDWQALGAD